MDEIAVVVFDDGSVVLEWWSEDGAELAKLLGSDPTDTNECPWCG